MQDHNHDNSNLPARRRAATELPDQEAVGAAGIDLPREEALAVFAAVSRVAGKGRSKARMHVHDMLMGLAFMAREQLERNGQVEPAPFPELPLERWPQGPEVFRKLGITNRDLEGYWAQARHRADDASLPLEWALALVPAPAWPMISRLIAWGPERVRMQMEWAVATMAQTTTQRHRRRRAAGSPLSLSTIERRVGGVWQLLDVFCELRSLATISPVLSLSMFDAWTLVPDRVDARAYGAREAGQDNSGPSIEACSQQLKLLTAQALRSTPRDGYLKRRRALKMGLLCMYGPRADAFRTARVEDFISDHKFPDGTTGPVLRVYPAKTWEPDEAHYLPLSKGLADRMVDWILFTGREVGQPNEPLFPNRKPKAGHTNEFMTPHGFYTAIAGARQKGGTGSYPLMARGADRFIGWHPHAYRHEAYQLAVQAATNLQSNDPGFFPHVHPHEFAKAIVGHHLVNDVGAVYRDLDRQSLCRAVVDEMWRVLYDEGVLRRGPDIDRVRCAREQRDALLVTLDGILATILDREAKAERAAGRASNGRDKQRRLELKLQAAEHRLDANGRRDDLRRFQESLEQAELELEAAQTTLVPIPEYVSDAEHARSFADALGQSQQATAPTPALALPDEVPLKDVAVLFGTTPQAIGRWRRLGQPKNRPLRWHGGEDAWHDHTEKDRRLRRNAINMQELTPDQERLLEETLIRLAVEDGRTNPATSPDGQLDAWETSGSSPPPQPTVQEAPE